MTATITADGSGAGVLLALAVVIVATSAAGRALARVGQPRVCGEILAGVLLGPSLLGALWPGAVERLFPPAVVADARVLAQLGLVLFMFLVGLELDLSSLRGIAHRAVVISQVSIAAPLALGAALALWLHPRLGEGADRLGFVLFLGAAMAITAFPVLARVLQESGLARTPLGVLVITCAAVDDVTAWCVLAGVVAVVDASGPGDVVQVVVLSLALTLAMVLVVRPALARLSTVPVWLALGVALVAAWASDAIGVHAIFGAFLAGVAVPRHGAVAQELHSRLEPVTVGVLLPVFFAVAGLATRIDLLDDLYLWGVTALVILVAVVGKGCGSLLAARAVGVPWREAAAVGVLMNTRGLTELVILSVGLELGVIGPRVYTVMVLMALVTTLMAAPLLARLVPVPGRTRRSPART